MHFFLCNMASSNTDMSLSNTSLCYNAIGVLHSLVSVHELFSLIVSIFIDNKSYHN
jgi:hypothetical protein